MKFLFWSIIFISGFLLGKGNLAEYRTYDGYQKESHHRPNIRNYSGPNSYPQKYDRRYPSASSKTNYGFHTVQSNISDEENMQNFIKPHDKKTQYYFVTTNMTTFYVPGRLHKNVYSNQKNSHQSLQYQHGDRHVSNCIKCPPEKIMIARKGLDGVLVEPPKLMSCHNNPISKEVYQIETLFGPNFKFLLPHGTHSIHAKIHNRKSKKHLQTCLLRYKVVVQQCGRFFPQNENLKVNCDKGYIWGSKCYFYCRSGYLSHNRPLICGDILQWEGDEPKCLPYPSVTARPCDFLGIPNHGKFSCNFPKSVDSESHENEFTTPEGTICRVICDHSYEIPKHLQPYSVLRCENGRWNVTANYYCQSKIYNL